MATEPATGAHGRVVTEHVVSGVLRGNRAGDPHVRRVPIYLPPSYDRNFSGRFPVLYLHDGQNVFSTAGTNVAFGWGSWELDRTVDELSRAGKMQEIIMVAVNNSAARMTEYSGRARAPGDPAPTNSAPAANAFENYVAHSAAKAGSAKVPCSKCDCRSLLFLPSIHNLKV